MKKLTTFFSTGKASPFPFTETLNNCIVGTSKILMRVIGRVERGSFTLTLSQNRA